MTVSSSTNVTYTSTTSEEINPSVTVTDVSLSNAIIDELKLVSDSDDDITAWTGVIEDTWGMTTNMLAKFDGNLIAGSVEESSNNTQEIRVKRREKGTQRWQTLYVHEVLDTTDFAFEWYDTLAASNKTYEYAYVPLVNGEESNYHIQEVESSFSDYFLCESDTTAHAVVNSTDALTYNQEASYQTTLGRKYPFVIKNGMIGYYTGTLEATWVSIDDKCDFDFENGALYRLKIDQFLADGKPKILKDWQGNMFMVMIVDTIPQDTGDHYYLPVHQMSWVECGDVSSIGELYDNGFINTDLDR